MSHFCFYFGKREDVAERMRLQASGLWGEIVQRSSGNFRLFIPQTDCDETYVVSTIALGAVSGYARKYSLAETLHGETQNSVHHREFIGTIIDDRQWPLSSDWTGNFAAAAYSKQQGQMVLCNDAIGYLPVYYTVHADGVLGGTSLIVLGRCLGCEVDAVGVLQAITLPYCTYGRRTILKQVSRLLPGERIRFSIDGNKVHTFDNELCNGVVDSKVSDAARQIWDVLQRETDLALPPDRAVCVALSGGWDSRLALATVSSRASDLKCYTFGSSALHEVRTARECALAIGANHQSFPIENTYFPDRDNLEELVAQTETANQLQWCTITDAIKSNGTEKNFILLGDLCESISALNMRQFSTREARIKLFGKGLLGQTETILPATPAAFAQWKEAKRAEVVRAMLRNVDGLSPELVGQCDAQELEQQLSSDLDLCFERVANNNPAFAPMFEEIFNWFHRARFLIAGQALLLSSRLRPRCPAVSLNFMRQISRLHPRLRVRRRLMNAIAMLPEFDVLARIPSAQIPWISARTPALLREIVWGARSGTDQVLMRRALRKKNPDLRMRVVPTLNYLQEYRRDTALANVQSWFSGTWIKPDKYCEIVRRRAALAAWPLTNVDIAAAANVSILLDVCFTNRAQDPSRTAAEDLIAV